MKNKKILVIDDEKDSLELFSRVLNKHYVKTAENEKEALAYIAREAFDLIFLDVIMPGNSALELFKLIRKMRPKSPIIMMTGFAVEEELRQAIKLGAAGIMHKPFEHINDIKRAVERVLGKRKGG